MKRICTVDDLPTADRRDYESLVLTFSRPPFRLPMAESKAAAFHDVKRRVEKRLAKRIEPTGKLFGELK